MTSDATEKLRAIVEAMTPGPWEHSPFEGYDNIDAIVGTQPGTECALAGDLAFADARGIVVTHNVMRELLAVVEAASCLRELMDGVEPYHARLHDDFNRALDALEDKIKEVTDGQ